MIPETDPNTFTQKDLMQHLLHASQHAVTREEMSAQFAQAEGLNKERFKQMDERFAQAEERNKERFVQAEALNKERSDQVDKRFDQVNISILKLGEIIDKQSKKHDRLVWAIFLAMLTLFCKDYLTQLLIA